MRNKTTKRFARAILPFLLLKLPFTPVALAPALSREEVQAMEIERQLEERGEKIDAYFESLDMPLLGYGRKMAREAEKNDLDWRLLPALAIRESSGGKNACGNNPFGWGSCKINFDTMEKAIEVVAWNLGANNPATFGYYQGDLPSKLKNYNGGAVRLYHKQVLKIMERIGKGA